MITFLKQFMTRPKSLAHWSVTVYSREGCTCCDKALGVLEPYRRRHKFTVDVVDIDADPALVEAHGLSVPVVEINGKVRFKGVVNPHLLERLIEADLTEADATEPE